MCIKNDNHMMHGSWDTKCDRQNFLSFWAIFYPFIPPNNPKSQNFEKIIKKKHGDIIILHKWTINDNHKMYGSLRFKARQTEFFVILGHFLPFNLTNNPKKQNFQKMKKNIWRYLHFTHVFQKLWSDDVRFLWYGAQRTNRKSDIQRWVPN